MSRRPMERPLAETAEKHKESGTAAGVHEPVEREVRLPESLTPVDQDSGAFVRRIRQALELTRKDFARLTGFSERAIADWEAGKALSGVSRQRMQEMQALQTSLGAIAEPGEIGPWLLRPNEAFGGLKPLEVVERGEIHRLWQMLFWLQSGVSS